MMGGEGLTRATEVAILERQLRRGKRLDEHYPVLYRGKRGPGGARVHPRPARR